MKTRSHADHAAQIAAEMIAACIETPPAAIVFDGRVHRFKSAPAQLARTGWFVAHDDPAGPRFLFGDWRAGIKQAGKCDPGRKLRKREAAQRRRRLKKRQNAATWEEAKFQAGAAIEAQARWDRCSSASANHEYLRRKSIKPHGLRMDGQALLVPMRDVDGELWSIQEIRPDGFKSNQTGARRRSCFTLIGEAGGTLCICEGFATAASIREATGNAVAAAGDAGNLEPRDRAAP